MTTEEKAKAYDEAIKRGLDYIRQTPATEMVTRQDVFEAIFPEYAESVEERVRKEIIDFIQWAEDRGMTRHDYHQAKRPAVWIAYLEKLKENTWSEDDDAKVKAMVEEGELKPSEREWLKNLRNRVWEK